MSYHLTPHAARRLQERQVTPEEIQALLYSPHLVTPAHRTGFIRHAYHDLSAIIAGRRVITIMRRYPEEVR